MRLNLIDYKISQYLRIADIPFYALIAAAMGKADSNNMEFLREAFPDIYQSFSDRYNAPGGLLEEDTGPTKSHTDIMEEANGIARSYLARLDVL